MSEESLGFDIFARDRASRVFNTVGNSAQRLERQSSSVGGSFKKMGGLIAMAGKTAALGAGVAAVGAVTMGIKTAASLEQMQVAFTTLLHSGTKAQAFIGQLKNFAAKTPFELPGVVDAARQLLGVGASAKSVIPTLTAWGDTAGALGLSQDQFSRSMIALTQSMANGKIQAGDMLQITQAGIPIWSLMAKALGMPVSKVRELSASGKLLTKDVLPKLQAQMEKDYGGAMAKQSQTLTGVWSTFMDTLKLGLAQAVQPLLPILKTAIPAAAQVLGVALKGLAAVFKFAIVGIKGLADWLGPKFKGSSKEGADVLTQFRTLFNHVFSDVTQWIQKNKATINDWGQRIGAIFKTVLQIVSGVLKILIILWDKFGKDLLNLLGGAITSNIKILQGGLMTMKGVVDVILGLLTGDWKKAFHGLSEIGHGQMLQIKAIIERLLGLIKITFSVTMKIVNAVFGGAMRNMASAASSMASRVVSRIASMIAKIRSIGGIVRGVFSGAGSWLWNAGYRIIQGLINGVQSAIGRLRSLLNSVTSWIPSWKGPPEKDRKLLVPAGKAIMAGLIGSIRGETGALKSTLGDVTRTIGVHPNVGANASLTAAVAGNGAAGGAVSVQIEWVGKNGGDEFMKWLRNNIRVRSGGGPNSVQKALGG